MTSSLTHDLLRSWRTLSFALLALFVYARFRTNRKLPLPPGPPGLPIIGNILSLIDRPWLKFEEWKKTYGPLVYINIAGQKAVVIGNNKIAADLLDRKAVIYSDRPHNLVGGELLNDGLLFAFAQHGEKWRRQRRGAHEALNNQVSKKYYAFQQVESVILAEAMLNSPADWDRHFRRAAASLIMSILYGSPPLRDYNDPIITRVNSIVHRTARAGAPGAFLVDTVYFSWLRYLPRWMCAWRREAEENCIRDTDFFKKLYEGVRERVKSGDETPSVCADLIQDPKESLSDQEAAWLAGTLYMAGAETSATTLSWFTVAMVLYPEFQKRAQEELDRVVGHDRVPTFADRDNLPYISALVKEILRWRPVGPMGVPHRLCQDDVYDGYFLPKDTLCIVNILHLNRDPDVWGPNADEFNPERQLDADGKLKPALADTKDENHVSFGFGRRICVGRHVANNSVFIQIAMLLWAFKISPAKDELGRDILPDPMQSVDEGVVVRPKSFECEISPRFEAVPETLLHTKELYEMY